MQTRSDRKKLIRLILSALFLAMALALPFLTGQNRQLGNMLCLMHLPVLLCGFVCGPLCGAVTGAVAPLLRFALFGMPPIMPTGIAMSFELITYGLLAGCLYRALPRRKWAIYLSLTGAMLAGRAVWGAAMAVLAGLGRAQFGWSIFWANGFAVSLPGIALQIVLIPVAVMALEKAFPAVLNPEKQANKTT